MQKYGFLRTRLILYTRTDQVKIGIYHIVFFVCFFEVGKLIEKSFDRKRYAHNKYFTITILWIWVDKLGVDEVA